ncbi:hypothetical protein K466DRAFT_570870, partial [Polyporus arcularius HHB13444]
SQHQPIGWSDEDLNLWYRTLLNCESGGNYDGFYQDYPSYHGIEAQVADVDMNPSVYGASNFWHTGAGSSHTNQPSSEGVASIPYPAYDMDHAHQHSAPTSLHLHQGRNVHSTDPEAAKPSLPISDLNKSKAPSQSTNTAVEHVKSDKRTFACEVNQCGKLFARKDSLQRHVRMGHNKASVNLRCAKSYKSAYTFRRHMSDVHAEKECNRPFSTLRGLKQHVRCAHEDPAIYPGATYYS